MLPLIAVLMETRTDQYLEGKFYDLSGGILTPQPIRWVEGRYFNSVTQPSDLLGRLLFIPVPTL
jgi:hypothetical protein